MDRPNTVESVLPLSGQYSLKKDFHLNIWLGVATLFYVAGVFLLKRHPHWSPLARGVVALAPLLPGLLYARSWRRFVRGMDELQRRVQLEVFVFTALGTVLFEAVLETLHAQGAAAGVFPQGLGLGGTFVALLVLWLAGTVTANRRYR